MKTREELRKKGQFWTPSWVADAMVRYVAADAKKIFDPGVGMGVFYSALKKFDPTKHFFGTDVDSEVLERARSEGVLDSNAVVEVRDFILRPPKKSFDAIVANPPYIRHHRLSTEYKEAFNKIGLRVMGKTIDGRAGLHIYFLIQALSLLRGGGRLAFIMPADTCEGVFADSLWAWISRNFQIEGAITFEPHATPFPGVDTNAIILLIRNAQPSKKMKWVRCRRAESEEFMIFLENQLKLQNRKFVDLEIFERDLDEAMRTGLSRPPQEKGSNKFTLADFAATKRGIATGANEFFFLTQIQARQIGIPRELLIPAIGRTGDAKGSYITAKTVSELVKKGRPTLLFAPNQPWEELPKNIRSYIRQGERSGLSTRALISTRRPWYKMESRKTPPFLFAYLGRRNARFIKNDAGLIPLTGFLCVYPHSSSEVHVEKLWKLLQDPRVIANLHLVGKSYGSGAIKVEPRSLERLPIPWEVISEHGLSPKEEVSG